MIRILQGDCREMLKMLPDASVQCCVTSPPYFGLRAYLPDGHADKTKEMGAEQTPAEYVVALVEVFREVRRVLKPDGICWIVIGDSYASSPLGNKTVGVSASSTLNGVNGSSGRYRETLAGGHATKRDTSKIAGLKPKDLIGIPWSVAFALRDDGWWLRQDNVWSKPAPMPESVTDRTTRNHEYVFHFSKSASYCYNSEAIAERAVSGERFHGSYQHGGPGERTSAENGRQRPNNTTITRNRRSVWTIDTQPFPGAHFATMPEELATICILAGSRPGDMVLDPFGGSGTTGAVAYRLGRDATLIDLNPQYCKMAERRVAAETPPLPFHQAVAD